MRDRLLNLVDRFFEIHGVQGEYDRDAVVFEFNEAPHVRPAPLNGQIAVYLFFQDEQWLRIGKATYPQRFTSQHYGTRRASRTFALDIWRSRDEFGFAGQEAQIDVWLVQNFGRANIRVPADYGERFVTFLEAFLHFHLQPRFEGRRPRVAGG